MPPEKENDQGAPPFLIGISGCPSSGKTMLSLMLASILGPYSNPDRKGRNENAQPGVDVEAAAVIRQDDHMRPESDWPTVQFMPAPGDAHWENPSAEVAPNGGLQAKSPDHIEAVNWTQLSQQIENFRNGLSGHSSWADVVQSTGMNPASMLSVSEVKKQLDKLEAFMQEVCGGNSDVGFPGKYFKLGANKAPHFGCKFGIVDGSLIFVKEEAHLTDDEMRSRGISMPELDVGLFLPVSQDVARERRFASLDYIDFPFGRRVLGQFFKTEGYFEQVAWPRSELSHALLLTESRANPQFAIEGMMLGGIHVRGHMHASLKGTVSWALKLVLEEMATREWKAREQWRMQSS